VHGDRGRADITGDAVGLVLQLGPERDDGRPAGVVVAVYCGGGCPLALTQDALHLRQQAEIDIEIGVAPVALDRGLEPVEVAQRLVHVRLVDLDIAEPDGGIARDDLRVGRLAHHLRVDDGVLRHVDDKVALDGGGAGEAAAVGQAAHALVALLLRPLGRDVVERGDNLVLGEMAFLDLDLAAPAGGAAAAHALHVDAELARGVEHRRTDRKAPALAGRHEEDERVGDVGRGVHDTTSIWEMRLPSGRRRAKFELSQRRVS